MRASLRHNLRCSVIDGTAYMVMEGLAGIFFPIFVLLMFKDPVSSGLVLTLPMLLASVLQLGAPMLVRQLQSYRKAVVLCAAVQTFTCFPLAAIAMYGAMSPDAPGLAMLILTFLVASLYYAGAVVGGSPWSALISVLIPTHVRTRFMSRRNRTLQLGAVVGVAAGAVMLEVAPRVGSWLVTQPGDGALHRALITNPQLSMFAVLFCLAGIARAISTYYLHAHTEPPHAQLERQAEAHASVQSVTGPAVGFMRGAHASMAIGIIAFHGAMMIGSPFFAAYAREVGKASMLEYAGLVVVFLLGKALALNWAGDYAQRHGKHRLMVMSLLLTMPIPVLWALSTNLVWLVVAQLIAGVALGAYELAVWFMTVDAYSHPSLSPSQRTRLLARFSLATSLAGAATSALAGQLIDQVKIVPFASPQAMGELGAAWFPFFAVFALSALARGVVALWISRRTRAGWLKG